jgi:hypothetical protein
MPSIIPSPGPAVSGGVFHLPEALSQFPNAAITLYNRVSSHSQAGPAKARLGEKTHAIVSGIRELAPGKVKAIFQGIEKGGLTVLRPVLIEAAADARRRGGILVAADLSRFVRAKSYSRTANRDACPTQSEFRRLRKLTLGVPLATVEDPILTEDERHSRATRRTGRAGRPRAIDDDLALRILNQIDGIYLADTGGTRWFPSVRQLARTFRVSPATILRLVYRPSPMGETWWNLLQEHAEQLPAGVMLEPRKCLRKCFKTYSVGPPESETFQNGSSAFSLCFSEDFGAATRVLKPASDLRQGI